jgi:hypothetical protein
MTLADDLRSMLDSSADLCPGPKAVTLKSGAIVQALPGIASREDVAMGGETINGTERTLRFATEDVPGLKAGDPLTWNSKRWVVIYPQLIGNGSLTKVFLQERP